MRYLHAMFGVFIAGMWACAGDQVIPLTAAGARVELASAEPDRESCTFRADVQGEAKSTDVGVANENARNDIKNKAAARGANFVALDTNTAANAMDWTGRNKVVLAGRAFTCR